MWPNVLAFDLGDANFKAQILKEDHVRELWVYNKFSHAISIKKLNMLYFFQSSKAIKQLTANHRLILSGTPIQNNVLELWSLFDFLMPGFLGTERQFTAKYSRPILASRDPKSSPSEQEAGKCLVTTSTQKEYPYFNSLLWRPKVVTTIYIPNFTG